MSEEYLGESNGPKLTGKRQASGKRRTNRGSDIGRALRSVYDETLREDVPDDFEDLLRKLS